MPTRAAVVVATPPTTSRRSAARRDPPAPGRAGRRPYLLPSRALRARAPRPRTVETVERSRTEGLRQPRRRRLGGGPVRFRPPGGAAEARRRRPGVEALELPPQRAVTARSIDEAPPATMRSRSWSGTCAITTSGARRRRSAVECRRRRAMAELETGCVDPRSIAAMTPGAGRATSPTPPRSRHAACLGCALMRCLVTHSCRTSPSTSPISPGSAGLAARRARALDAAYDARYPAARGTRASVPALEVEIVCRAGRASRKRSRFWSPAPVNGSGSTASSLTVNQHQGCSACQAVAEVTLGGSRRRWSGSGELKDPWEVASPPGRRPATFGCL